MQESSQQPAAAGCFYKRWEVAVKRPLVTRLGLITAFREMSPSDSQAKGLQVQTKQENSLKLLFGKIQPYPNYTWSCS